MTEITYNFGANEQTLEAIQRAINDIGALHEDVNKIFQALPDLYTGQQADALQQKHDSYTQRLNDLLDHLRQTQTDAVNQQHDMQALDARLAGGF